MRRAAYLLGRMIHFACGLIENPRADMLIREPRIRGRSNDIVRDRSSPLQTDSIALLSFSKKAQASHKDEASTSCTLIFVSRPTLRIEGDSNRHSRWLTG